MHEYRLAYRHENGEIEGFVGSNLSKDGAKANAIARAKAKVDQIEGVFNKASLIHQVSRLRPETMEKVRLDWRLGAI